MEMWAITLGVAKQSDKLGEMRREPFTDGGQEWDRFKERLRAEIMHLHPEPCPTCEDAGFFGNGPYLREYDATA